MAIMSRNLRRNATYIIPPPTVTNTWNNAQPFSNNVSVSLGTAQNDRIVVLGQSHQGQNNSNAQPTLNGVTGDYHIKPSSANTWFTVWLWPTGTSATLDPGSIGSWGGNSIWTIRDWNQFRVHDVRGYYGFDVNDWSYTIDVPRYSVMFGVNSTNEDGDANAKEFSGWTRDFTWNGGEEDAIAFHKINTVENSSLSVTCDSGGKRRSYGSLTLVSGNYHG